MGEFRSAPTISPIRRGAPACHDGQPECSTNELAHSNLEVSPVVARLLPDSEISLSAASVNSISGWDFRIQADGFPD